MKIKKSKYFEIGDRIRLDYWTECCLVVTDVGKLYYFGKVIDPEGFVRSSGIWDKRMDWKPDMNLVMMSKN